MKATERWKLVDVVMGEDHADIAVTNGVLVNVLTHEVYQAGVAVKGDTIAMVGDINHTIGPSTEVIDAQNQYIVPGFVEHHTHTFESQITPTQFARLTLPHGTTAWVTDEYGVGVVSGIEALRFIIEETKRLPQRVFFNHPLGTGYIQNVPFGHTGHLGQDDVREMMRWKDWHGVSEVYPQIVLNKDPFLFEMIEEAEKKGLLMYSHTRLERGLSVQALLNLNLRPMDHECTQGEEVIEKARLGEFVSLKGRQFRSYGEGPLSSGAEFLEPLINGVIDTRRFTVNIDTASPVYLAVNGHIDFILRMGVRRGIDPITMIQMATINAAEFMRVDHLIGSIGPGKLADLLIIDNLADINVKLVMVNGEIVAENGQLTIDLKNPEYPDLFYNTVRLTKVPEPADFRVEAPEGKSQIVVRVLMDSEDPDKRANAGLDVKEMVLPVKDGAIQTDPTQRIAKVVVMDRHNMTGKIGKGFLTGSYLARGAIGTTYNCQIEDLAIIGMSDEDIALCARTIQEMGGGWCAVLDGEVLAKVEMALCGLLADEPYELTVEKIKSAYKIAQEKLGSELEDPYRGPTKVAMCVTHSPTHHMGREGLVRPFEKVPLIVE